MTTTEIKNRIYAQAIFKGASKDVARCIVAQSEHETGVWTSNVFKTNNNCFGMRMPSIRKSPYIIGAGTKPPASEGPTPYAHYASIEDSVSDLFEWFKYNHVNLSAISTPEQYDAMLSSKGYHAQAQTIYTAALIRYFNELKSFVFSNPTNGIAILVLIIGVAILFYHKK